MAMRQTFDFECRECGTTEVKKCTVSEYQVISKEQVRCPICGGVMLRKFTRAPEINFKGEGWPDKKAGEGC